MPVVDFTSGWADNAEQTVLAAACRITAIEIQPHEQQVNTVFLQLFNSANPDLAGGDAPDMVIPIPSGARQGRGTAAQNGNVAYGGKRRQKIVFPNGGLRYDTAVTIALSTTATTYTAATTTSLPPLVRVFYTIGG